MKFQKATEHTPEQIELARRIADRIEQDPDSLKMATWVESSRHSKCRTVGCIAGWAVVLHDGMEAILATNPARPSGGQWEYVRDPATRRDVEIAERARALLGLKSDIQFYATDEEVMAEGIRVYLSNMMGVAL